MASIGIVPHCAARSQFQQAGAASGRSNSGHDGRYVNRVLASLYQRPRGLTHVGDSLAPDFLTPLAREDSRHAISGQIARGLFGGGAAWAALRFLAKPGRTKHAISRKASILLEAERIDSHLGMIFQGSNLSPFEYIDLLGAVVRGDESASQRVREIAAVLAPQLSIRRGPKVSRASVAHELLLTITSEGYTWDDSIENFAD